MDNNVQVNGVVERVTNYHKFDYSYQHIFGWACQTELVECDLHDYILQVISLVWVLSRMYQMITPASKKKLDVIFLCILYLLLCKN